MSFRSFLLIIVFASFASGAVACDQFHTEHPVEGRYFQKTEDGKWILIDRENSRVAKYEPVVEPLYGELVAMALLPERTEISARMHDGDLLIGWPGAIEIFSPYCPTE